MESLNIMALSIVSHGQGELIRNLLNDLNCVQIGNFEVIITLNIPEDDSFLQGYNFDVLIIRNLLPKGFGANHNAAFSKSSSKFFAIVNPDIRIREWNLNTLLEPFKIENVMVVAPLILSSEGKVEDSARRFPTVLIFFKRIFLRLNIADYEVGESPYPVDWVAGMFVVFKREAFNEVGGFDETRFYMYLEDADICRRIGINGGKVVVNPSSQVIHMARRASRRNLKHMRWHLVSAVRYLTGF